MISLAQASAGAAVFSIAGLMGAGMLAAVPADAAGTGPVSAQDITWAQANAQTDLAEIAFGQIAEQRALRSDTKVLAQVTMSDHEKALSELKTVASQVGITLPTAPSAAQQALAAQLRTVTSGQFDTTFDSIEIKGHEQSISQTETEIAKGSSTAVKNFASVYLPVAEKHLRMAEMDYAAATGATGRAPRVSAGTGGMAAIRPADDEPWLGLGVAGGLLIAGAGAIGLRRRIAAR
jgi:putative membrane protein